MNTYLVILNDTDNHLMMLVNKEECVYPAIDKVYWRAITKGYEYSVWINDSDMMSALKKGLDLISKNMR